MRKGILWLLFGLCLLICPAPFALADPNKTQMNLEVSGKPDGGTVSGILGEQSWSPVVAYDPENNRYLVVYEHVTEDFEYQIFGGIVTLDGAITYFSGRCPELSQRAGIGFCIQTKTYD